MEGRFGDIRVAPLYAARGTRRVARHRPGRQGLARAMQLLPGLILHGDDGKFTPAAEAILREGAAWPMR